MITILLKSHLPEVKIGIGYTEAEAKIEKHNLKQLRKTLDSQKSAENFPFSKFFFGRLLDYAEVEKLWQHHGAIMEHVTIDCHNNPEFIEVDPEFETDQLLSFFKYCGATLTTLRINLPRTVIESDELFPKNSKKNQPHSFPKLQKLSIMSKLMHNFCEMSYTQIELGFWKHFLSTCPQLKELTLDFDLDPEQMTSMLPMFTAIKGTVANSLTLLKINCQLSNEELQSLAKLGNQLNLEAFHLTRFHCTAKANKLQAFLKTQSSTLKKLKLIYDCYYVADEIEFESLDPPDFGDCKLPEMTKLEKLTISGTSDGPFRHLRAPKLRVYNIFVMDVATKDEIEGMLNFVLPLNKEGRPQDRGHKLEVNIYNLPRGLSDSDAEARVAMCFPEATFFTGSKRLGDNYYYGFE